MSVFLHAHFRMYVMYVCACAHVFVFMFNITCWYSTARDSSAAHLASYASWILCDSFLIADIDTRDCCTMSNILRVCCARGTMRDAPPALLKSAPINYHHPCLARTHTVACANARACTHLVCASLSEAFRCFITAALLVISCCNSLM